MGVVCSTGLGWRHRTLNLLRIVVIAVCALVLGVAAAWTVRRASSPFAPSVSVEIVSPRLSANGSLIARPSESLEVTFSVHNTGDQPIAEVAADPSCTCQMRENSPRTIARSESATFRVKFVAPPAGSWHPTVNFLAGADRRLIASKVVPMYVPYTLPTWLRQLDSVSSTHVHGEPIRDTFTFATLERAGEPHWLNAVVLDAELAASAKLSVEEKAYAFDEGVVSREYSISLEVAEAPIGKHTGQILLTGKESAKPIKTLTYHVSVPSTIRIVPDTMDLDYGRQSAPEGMLTLVFRSVVKSLDVQYDKSLLRVTALDLAGEPRYRVEALRRPDRALDTTVVFADKNLGPQGHLLVRILP